MLSYQTLLNPWILGLHMHKNRLLKVLEIFLTESKRNFGPQHGSRSQEFSAAITLPGKTMFTLGLDPGFGWGSCPRCPARWPWIFKRVPVVVAPSFWPLWWRTGGPMIFSSPRRWIFKRHPSALELNLCTNHCIFYALTTAY